MAVGVSDGLVAHVSVELLAPVRHPLRERAGESVGLAACFAKIGGAAEDALGASSRNGVVVQHRKRPVEMAVSHGEVAQLLPCRHRSGKAAGEATAPSHAEGLHVDEGTDSA